MLEIVVIRLIYIFDKLCCVSALNQGVANNQQGWAVGKTYSILIVFAVQTIYLAEGHHTFATRHAWLVHNLHLCITIVKH